MTSLNSLVGIGGNNSPISIPCIPTAPTEANYTTLYVYKTGELVGTFFNDEIAAYEAKGTTLVRERVFDVAAYRAAMFKYNTLVDKIEQGFIADLFRFYDITDDKLARCLYGVARYAVGPTNNLNFKIIADSFRDQAQIYHLAKEVFVEKVPTNIKLDPPVLQKAWPFPRS